MASGLRDARDLLVRRAIHLVREGLHNQHRWGVTSRYIYIYLCGLMSRRLKRYNARMSRSSIVRSIQTAWACVIQSHSPAFGNNPDPSICRPVLAQIL